MQSNIIPTTPITLITPILETSQNQSRSTTSNLIRPSTPTKSNLSQNDEGCFVEPPFPSPMPNPINRRSLSSTSTEEIIKLHQSTPIIASTSSSYPIQRLIQFQSLTSTKPSEEKKIDFMSELPIELGLYIILKINQVSSMVKCREVSKNWKKVAEDPVVWHELFKTHSNWKVKEEFQIKSKSSSQLTPIEKKEEEAEEEEIKSKMVCRRGSSNKLVARRFSQLIGIEDLSKPITPSTNPIMNRKDQEEEEEVEREGLDWFKVFRDRYVIESRWKSGDQVSRSLKGHKDSVYCLQFDEEKIVTGSRDRSVKVWDIKTGLCQHTLNGHQGSVLCLKFSGSDFLLTGSSDCKVIQWDMKTGEKKKELIGHRSGVLDLSINSNYIVSCSKDTTIKLWNRFDLSLLRTIEGHTGPVNAIEVSKDGQLLVSASGDSTMKLWNPLTGELLRTCEGHLRGLACIKLIEELGLVISGSNDETVKVWDLRNGQCLRTLLGHEGLVRTLDVDVNERRLVTGSYDKTIKVWDFETGLMKLDFRKGQKSIVFDVSIDLHQIISVGHDSNITILDFADGIDCKNFI